ncbi:MAG: hypothetical protein OXI96_00575 [Acidimicrobiaceae bacterium]|nr:hypothetical protein [Acidimicrobiaceae bacterium]
MSVEYDTLAPNDAELEATAAPAQAGRLLVDYPESEPTRPP